MKIMKIMLALCALLVSASASSEVLIAKATFNKDWRQGWGDVFELSYQLASTPVYASIGEDVLVWQRDVPNVSYIWNVTDPSKLLYLQKGLQTAGDDYWFLGGSGSIWLSHDRCVTGTSNDCGIFHPDMLVNGKVDLTTATLSRVLVTLEPFEGGYRSGTVSLFASFTSDIPEPGTCALFGLGIVGLAAFGRRRAARTSLSA